jgi:hypothetical protein
MLLLNDTGSNSTCAIMARDGAHALVLGRVGFTVFFFIGEFSTNPFLKNVISTNIKDFSWKNGPNSPNFEKKEIFKSPDF